MLKVIRNWIDRRIIESSGVSATQWESAIASLPLLAGLSADERLRLKELAILFCHRKSFEGAQGLVVNQEMATVIALQACLPILELGLEVYDDWTSVIVYPSGFAPEYSFVDEYGITHHVKSELSGEAWQRGPVLLAWDDVFRASDLDGYNLVIHELAHKLDMQNGEANGFPPLHRDMNTDSWSSIFSRGYDDFANKCGAGVDLGIDCYAAESPAEYFAVMSEVFFEKPKLLQRHYPAVYAQMRLYYRQDPVTRATPGIG